MSSCKTSINPHPYHLVELSHWPLLTAFSILGLMLGFAFSLHDYTGGIALTIASAIMVIFCSGSWWRDIILEGKKGHHNEIVKNGLRIGMGVFILSEVMFFFTFFFSYFYTSVFPTDILDGLWSIGEGTWPPASIKTFDPWDIPFINTLILLLSGTTVTWAHHAIENKDKDSSAKALGITVFLGFLFSAFQIYEYSHAAFGLGDGIYAANFYVATGFHGIHVFLGTIFLLICYLRVKKGHFVDGKGFLGFEFAAWYWHFVDVVWLFLFVFIYVLGE